MGDSAYEDADKRMEGLREDLKKISEKDKKKREEAKKKDD